MKGGDCEQTSLAIFKKYLIICVTWFFKIFYFRIIMTCILPTARVGDYEHIKFPKIRWVPCGGDYGFQKIAWFEIPMCFLSFDTNPTIP